MGKLLTTHPLSPVGVANAREYLLLLISPIQAQSFFSVTAHLAWSIVDLNQYLSSNETSLTSYTYNSIFAYYYFFAFKYLLSFRCMGIMRF